MLVDSWGKLVGYSFRENINEGRQQGASSINIHNNWNEQVISMDSSLESRTSGNHRF